MGLSIPEECYIYLEKKYGNLIYNICKQISGDPVVNSSHEDNRQELLIKCIEATHAYSRKIKQPDFNEFIKTRMFDKYIKTCLWNLKNSTGNVIVKNTTLYSTVALGSLDEDAYGVDIESPTGNLDVKEFLGDIKEISIPSISKALHYIVSDPGLLKRTGSLNISKLAKLMGISWKESKDKVSKIENILKRRIDYDD
jgi:hypothetical protein